MFFFKKLVAPFLMPVPFSLALVLLGLLLLWFTRRQRAGKWLATLGALLLLLLGYGFVSNRLLASLERQYAPVTDVAAAAGRVRWVVVLGGGSSADEGLPAALRLSEASLARLVEGVRLQRQLPESRLLVSGGAVFGSGADAETMRALAVELGVSPDVLELAHAARAGALSQGGHQPAPGAHALHRAGEPGLLPRRLLPLRRRPPPRRNRHLRIPRPRLVED
jgi:hypothetical protein